MWKDLKLRNEKRDARKILIKKVDVEILISHKTEFQGKKH